MMRALGKFSGAAWVPAGVIAVLGGGSWTGLRWATGPLTGAGTFVAWMALLMLGCTVVGIVWGAWAETGDATGARGRVFPGYALGCAAAGLLLLAVGCGGHHVSLGAAVRVEMVLAAWTGMWTALAVGLRRWGAGMSVGVTMVLALVVFAGPVTLVPLARWRPGLAVGIGVGCPMLAALDAARPDVQVNWSTRPTMYELSGLGQDVPLELPRWWACAGAYGLAAGVFMGAAWWRGRRMCAGPRR